MADVNGCSKDARSNIAHPRLYFTREDLPRLRQLRAGGRHAEIWKNLRASAEWCLTLTPRRAWIAPVAPDPVYENLYDRFFAIMGDLAVTEHLAFAYALGGEPRYGQAAREWTLASCRAWKPEAEGEPDGSKAYAVSRLLKGVAVGYDVLYDGFTDSERQEVRETLVAIAQKYYAGYFSTPSIAGEGFHAHHAIVEWSSFGVLALALRGEAPEAEEWLGAAVRKFQDHLLPLGLAADGAQVEGQSFWASTMQSRLVFLDALRRVTGLDLLRPFAKQMNADLALASVASSKLPGYDYDHSNVVLEHSFGQLNYFSPVLLFLAREYRRPTLQHLALWDRSLGSLQRTRYVTPNHGEQLMFGYGGYAYLWCDPTVPDVPDEKRLSYPFPSIDQAYLRASWDPDDLVVGVNKGQIVVHAGGVPALIEPVAWQEPKTPMKLQSLDDKGPTAVLRFAATNGPSLTVELNRPARTVVVRRHARGLFQFWCHGTPSRNADSLAWGDRVRVAVQTGRISGFDPAGYAPVLATAFGKLTLADPTPRKFPRVTIEPPDGSEEIVIAVSLEKR